MWTFSEAVSHLYKFNQKSFTTAYPEYGRYQSQLVNLWIVSALHVWIAALSAFAEGVHLICLCFYLHAMELRPGKGVEEKEEMRLWAGPRNCFSLPHSCHPLEPVSLMVSGCQEDRDDFASSKGKGTKENPLQGIPPFAFSSYFPWADWKSCYRMKEDSETHTWMQNSFIECWRKKALRVAQRGHQEQPLRCSGGIPLLGLQR